MEFDKSKILTVVTADQAKIGQKGWFADELIGLKKKVANSQPQRLIRVLPDVTCSAVFLSESGLAWVLFCPAQEPTDAERQAQWVHDNNVKVGTKVRIIREFRSIDLSHDCLWNDRMDKTIGLEGTVTRIDKKSMEVKTEEGSWWYPYFALEVFKELTYAERQEQWVKENNVEEGTKVRVTRTFAEDEDGSCCWAHDDLVSKTGIVQNICPRNLGININGRDLRAVPYFALEAIKEPTYRPFKNAEEFKPFRDEWFDQKDITRPFTPARAVNYCNQGVVMCKSVSLSKGVTFELCTYADLLKYFTRENGEPCGVRVE